MVPMPLSGTTVAIEALKLAAQGPEQQYHRAALGVVVAAVRESLRGATADDATIGLPAAPPEVAAALRAFGEAGTVEARMAALRTAVCAVAEGFVRALLPRELWIDEEFAASAAGVVRTELLEDIRRAVDGSTANGLKGVRGDVRDN